MTPGAERAGEPVDAPQSPQRRPPALPRGLGRFARLLLGATLLAAGWTAISAVSAQAADTTLAQVLAPARSVDLGHLLDRRATDAAPTGPGATQHHATPRASSAARRATLLLGPGKPVGDPLHRLLPAPTAGPIIEALTHLPIAPLGSTAAALLSSTVRPAPVLPELLPPGRVAGSAAPGAGEAARPIAAGDGSTPGPGSAAQTSNSTAIMRAPRSPLSLLATVAPALGSSAPSVGGSAAGGVGAASLAIAMAWTFGSGRGRALRPSGDRRPRSLVPRPSTPPA